MPLSGSFINALGVAVPDYAHSQHQLAHFMVNALQLDEPARRRMMALYRQTKISRRYSVLADYGQPVGQFTFYPNSPNLEPLPSVEQRMSVYQREALPLALRAVRACLADYPSFSVHSITHLIVVSCTGFYAPGPDIELLEALGLPGTTQRLLIGFMGCYGAFNGLKAADAIVRADPQANVLVVCVELCTIHFQKPENPSNWLANALFSDGAAAVLVQGTARREQSFQLQSFHCDLLPEGRDQMAWTIGNHGFDMVLTSTIPDLIQHHISLMLQRILEKKDLTVGDVDYFALHPGGRRILDLIELELGIDRSQTQHAYTVLNQYGNMSSATVLFVLKAIWDELAESVSSAPESILSGYSKRIAGVAFGPGLTLESMLLLVHVNSVQMTDNLNDGVSAETLELIEL
ncbi:type III polyketide synthase [Spirosoma terrae]|uniref:Type III polyketide synthase n=1 Tax=Spirosoma terrae TaxID=1968276 RepID=A0A6L9LHT1_9BACT|nr:type III polyketide synthase [Spirosoma terrae]NDU98761.1 type III polyketide synthase [Spirosoma terrae]